MTFEDQLCMNRNLQLPTLIISTVHSLFYAQTAATSRTIWTFSSGTENCATLAPLNRAEPARFDTFVRKRVRITGLAFVYTTQGETGPGGWNHTSRARCVVEKMVDSSVIAFLELVLRPQRSFSNARIRHHEIRPRHFPCKLYGTIIS